MHVLRPGGNVFGQSRLHVPALLQCHFFRTFVASSSSRRWIQSYHSLDERSTEAKFLLDVGVGVQAKDPRIVFRWQLVDLLPHLVDVVVSSGHLDAVIVEAELFVQRIGPELSAQHGIRILHVFIVCYSTSLIDHRYQEFQGVIGDLLTFSQILLQLKLAYVQIGVHPILGNIPSNGTEFTSFQNGSVEKRQ